MHTVSKDCSKTMCQASGLLLQFCTTAPGQSSHTVGWQKQTSFLCINGITHPVIINPLAGRDALLHIQSRLIGTAYEKNS